MEIQQLQNTGNIDKAVEKTFLLGPSYIIVKLRWVNSFSKESFM